MFRSPVRSHSSGISCRLKGAGRSVAARVPIQSPVICITVTTLASGCVLLPLAAFFRPEIGEPTWLVPPSALAGSLTLLPAFLISHLLTVRGRRESVMRERARVAADIHDIVGNHLSAIALQATAVMATAPRDDQKHLTALAEIRGSSLDAVGEIRRMVAALRTGAQGSEPVPASLDLARSLMERMERLGSPARLRTVGTPVALKQEIETAACRIIQESLTNGLKYAYGSAVDTVIAYRPDRVVITVENDLSGANPDLALTGSGFGLLGMVERAARIGGTCTARRYGDRWRVHAVLPLRPARRDRSGRSLSGGPLS